MPAPTDRRRARLLDAIRAAGVADERVLAALATLPREAFIPDSALHARAYDDAALPIGEGQTISQPSTVAYMTALLDVRPDERILEIGTGSGYQAAVLCALGARVFSVERHASLLRRTEGVLARLGYRVRTRLGDGTRGWPAYAPFDGILVTAGGAEAPPDLLAQLREPREGRPDARMIIPLGGRAQQTLYRITRIGAGDGPEAFRYEPLAPVRFVPLVSGA
ncbi:MAG: protein-L-isoaspartate(D-aspartate) O-methyltransferase [Rubricoccaceae bacterium]